MKKLSYITVYLFSILSLNTYAATKLTSFDSIQESVTNGNSINIVLKLGYCNTYSEKMDVDSIASIKLDKIKLVKNKELKTSSLHYTLDNPRYPNQVVYEHILYNLKSDGHAIVKYRPILNSPTAKPEYFKIFSCKLNDGINFFETT